MGPGRIGNGGGNGGSNTKHSTQGPSSLENLFSGGSKTPPPPSSQVARVQEFQRRSTDPQSYAPAPADVPEFALPPSKEIRVVEDGAVAPTSKDANTERGASLDNYIADYAAAKLKLEQWEITYQNSSSWHNNLQYRLSFTKNREPRSERLCDARDRLEQFYDSYRKHFVDIDVIEELIVNLHEVKSMIETIVADFESIRLKIQQFDPNSFSSFKRQSTKSVIPTSSMQKAIMIETSLELATQLFLSLKDAIVTKLRADGHAMVLNYPDIMVWQPASLENILHEITLTLAAQKGTDDLNDSKSVCGISITNAVIVRMLEAVDDLAVLYKIRYMNNQELIENIQKYHQSCIELIDLKEQIFGIEEDALALETSGANSKFKQVQNNCVDLKLELDYRMTLSHAINERIANLPDSQLST